MRGSVKLEGRKQASNLIGTGITKNQQISRADQSEGLKIQCQGPFLSIFGGKDEKHLALEKHPQYSLLTREIGTPY